VFLLLKFPEWYVVDTIGFVTAAGVTAILGISFGILPAVLLLIALAFYDAWAVYRTKHMITLADELTSQRLPILLVIPNRAGYSGSSCRTCSCTGPFTSSEPERSYTPAPLVRLPWPCGKVGRDGSPRAAGTVRSVRNGGGRSAASSNGRSSDPSGSSCTAPRARTARSAC